MDQNKFVSGQLNQIFCFQIQEHFKDAFCHPYYFVNTNEVQMQSTNYQLYKYADDIALVALME